MVFWAVDKGNYNFDLVSYLQDSIPSLQADLITFNTRESHAGSFPER